MTMFTLVITIHGVFGSKFHHQSLIDAIHGGDTDVCMNRALAFEWSWTEELDAVVHRLDAFIETHAASTTRHVVLVGHSAGGRIAAMSRNWRVTRVIAVASPLNGSALAWWVNLLTLGLIPALRSMGEPVQRPPQAAPLAVITCDCEFFSGFDGRVFLSEMVSPEAHIVGHFTHRHSGGQFSDERCTAMIIEWIGRPMVLHEPHSRAAVSLPGINLRTGEKNDH
jgi:pimeloyl-ACP methyl ester carboxylesterase